MRGRTSTGRSGRTRWPVLEGEDVTRIPEHQRHRQRTHVSESCGRSWTQARAASVLAMGDPLTFATFTFNGWEISERSALRKFGELCKTLAREYVKDHILVLAGWGRQWRGVWHLHAVYSRPPNCGTNVDPDDVARLWTHGRVESDLYLPWLGGMFYVQAHPKTELSLACPRTGPCAHRRCKVSPTGWPSPGSGRL